jgi:hypothetical protein
LVWSVLRFSHGLCLPIWYSLSFDSVMDCGYPFGIVCPSIESWLVSTHLV